MNYTLLVIFVACLIGCGAQIYTDVDLNAYCKDCMKEGSTSSVQPHPYRCDRYITCAIVSLDVFKAHEMPCPAGLFFDSTIKTCTWTPDCVRSCRTNDKFENSWDCNTYYECENGILSTGTPLKSCGKQKMFNETLQYCTPDNTCGKDAKSDNCTKTQKDCQVGYEFRKEECQCVKRTICTDQYNVMSPNSEVYLQLMNGKWIESKCIPGYSFNLTTCTCSDKIPIIYKCPESYKVHTDQGKYYILENSVYVERTCPSEHKFNLTDCRCHLQSK
ncbi:uncharacterized protein LOC106869024 [Octopus bimaculoides]|uniref:uncharacterized protein LOC106869024 n=1 Tax=Octopus bimaculoides TaxID=37653 RepID=UPI0022E423F6|nr:uncharacterized protein LOC106869024 [Octopus bimaculoides]